MSSFEELVNNYIAWDSNEFTRNTIQQLKDEKNDSKLTQLLTKRVQFGTAGLRAAMGAGYACMNDLVVLQTCQGLCRYLQSVDPNSASKGIVVGYDHRKLNTLSSLGFARMTAAVFLSQGFKVYLLEDFVATPFVPYAITHYGCAAGIMVTASHNPKQDNGYKVYWGNGAQIIPPHDANISNFINENLQPWQKYDLDGVPSHPLAHNVTEELAQSYISSITKMSTRGVDANRASSLKIAYTAMHGVGTQWILRAFESFGHNVPCIVPAQRNPDPEFSTVSFPNPEEKGALNLAQQYAAENSCTLILANDPDADRLAVAEWNPASNNWRVFSGNEIGVLLGYWQIQSWKRLNGSAPAATLASIVSSRMLKTICKVEGLQYYDTLTGFKWLGNRAMELRAAGTPVIFSYEEALGYCVGDVLCDKDGVSGASIFLEMASALANGWTEESGESGDNKNSRTVLELLQSLNSKYGEFVSYNSYVISRDTKKTDEIFHHLRTSGPESNRGYWTEAVGVPIVAITDVTKGYDSSSSDGTSSLPMTPESHMIMYEFANGVSVTLRTSGTEPKIKYYTEIAGKPGQNRSELVDLLHNFVDSLVDEMLQPHKYGLERA